MAKGMTHRSIPLPTWLGENEYLKGRKVELVLLKSGTRMNSRVIEQFWEDAAVEQATHLDFPSADDVTLTRANGTKIRLRYRPRHKYYVQTDDVKGKCFDIRFLSHREEGTTDLPAKEVSEWDIASPAKLVRLYLHEIGVELIVLHAKIADDKIPIAKRIELSEYLTALLRLQRRVAVLESEADVRNAIKAAIAKHLTPFRDHIESTRLDVN